MIVDRSLPPDEVFQPRALIILVVCHVVLASCTTDKHAVP